MESINPNLIAIKTRNNVQLIDPNEILYCVLNARKVDIILTSNECITTLHNLKFISERLNNFRFLRCHAKFLVNLDQRLKFDSKNREIELINGQKIKIAKDRKVYVNRILKEYNQPESKMLAIPTMQTH